MKYINYNDFFWSRNSVMLFISKKPFNILNYILKKHMQLKLN